MDEKLEAQLWDRYSAIWRNVLTRVLMWKADDIEAFVQTFHSQWKSRNDNHPDFWFFYDAPSAFLFRPILGGGLQERILRCGSVDAHPMDLFRQLVNAIVDSPGEEAMEAPDFDWTQARVRYELERKRIEDLLTVLESKSGGERARD